MAQKTSAQMDFADQMIVRSTNLNQRLDQIVRLIDWSRFESSLRSVFPSSEGRPGHCALMLFKSLLLQAWYNLSDYGLEEALDDRLSFRRFVGLSVGEKAPDHTTICRFRERLAQLKLTDRLFECLHEALLTKGLIVKKGTLVDATFVEAAVKRPDQGDDGKGGHSEGDQEARWAMQGKKRFFGYKGHVGVDMKSGLIRKAKVTPANTYEGDVFCEMVRGDEEWAIADKAYESQKNYDFLREKGIGSGMMFSARSCYALRPIEKYFNKVMAHHRAAVERVFGTLKRSYGWWRVRYKGRQKNHSWFMVLCMAFNMKKMVKLCV
jgi:transposase, IS5 family